MRKGLELLAGSRGMSQATVKPDSATKPKAIPTPSRWYRRRGECASTPLTHWLIGSIRWNKLWLVAARSLPEGFYILVQVRSRGGTDDRLLSSVTQGLRPAKFHEKVGALHLKPTFWQILGRHMFSMSYTGFSTLLPIPRPKAILVLAGTTDHQRRWSVPLVLRNSLRR